MSGLEPVIKSFYKIVKPVNNVASSAGMVCLAAMMFLTATDVILRYSLNKPILGSYELIQFLMVVTVSVGLAYCGLEKAHVTIDIITSHMPRRARAVVDSITGLLGLIVAALMTWQLSIYIFMLQKSQLVSTVLLIPIYPFVAVVAFGVALYCVVLVLHLLEFIMESMRN